MSWDLGYVSEIDYTHGYYRELSPLMLELCLLSRRQAHSVGRPLRYLELGFGQGLSLNIHAATMNGEFWGTDFNPVQAANARELASASGANIKVLDDSFSELAEREGLPEFDMIGLHGIWSWISAENRRVIVDIARRKLAVGGVFYISYNTTPGWSASMPLRHLMTLHSDLASGEAQGMVSRIDAALAFAQQVVDSNAMYFRANPSVAERLTKIRAQNRHYLAHEYFNADWDPMPFSQVAGMLSEAKLSFGASAHLFDHVDNVNFTPESQALMNGITHPILRESVRDYCVNQQFRRDIFVKGPRPLPAVRQAEMLKKMRFVLLTNRDDISLKVNCPLGEATLQAETYEPVIGVMAENRYAAKSLEELAGHESLKTQAFPRLIEVLLMLVGAGYASPVQDQLAVDAARPRTEALNARLVEQAAHSADVAYLASPLTGGGIAAARFPQLFLRAIKHGKQRPAEWAVHAWEALANQGQRLLKDGKVIESAEENIAELTRQAEEFEVKRLPVLRALAVA